MKTFTKCKYCDGSGYQLESDDNRSIPITQNKNYLKC